MKSYRVTGGGGVQLHVVETGNPKGRPILFIHGLSQNSLAWSRQLASDLADDFRLVALDLRGHGLSEKPRDAYSDSRVWADDVNAVIQDLDLRQPVLCGWSYGPLVMLDYVRHYGEDKIGGLHFVSGVTKLGNDEALAVLSAEFLELIPGLFSEDAADSVRALQSLLTLCFTDPPEYDEFYLMLGYNVSVPPHVRKALLSRSLTNDDILRTLQKPLLITHGSRDPIVKQVVVDQHKAQAPHAELHVMGDAGHAPFWDRAEAFNQRLRAFCDSFGEHYRDASLSQSS